MFHLSPPLESRKGYLVSVFQAGTMEFPESIGFNFPGWSSADYLRFCVAGLWALVQGKRDRACLPLSVLKGTCVLESFWGFAAGSDGKIAFGEFIRSEETHFTSAQTCPEDWWRDCSREAIANDGKPWGVTCRAEIVQGLELYEGFLSYVDSGRGCAEGGGLVLLPPLRAHGCRRSCWRLSPRCGLRWVRSSLCGLTEREYFTHWVDVLYHLLDVAGASAILVVDVDADGVPTTWMVVETDAGCSVRFSFPVSARLEACRFDRATGRFRFPRDCVRACRALCRFPHDGGFPSDELYREVYAGQTLLNRMRMVDDDDDIPSLAGMRRAASEGMP